MSLRRHARIPALAAAVVLVLTGCSVLPGSAPGSGDQPAPEGPPAFPVQRFEPLPAVTTTGAEDVIMTAAADKDTVVALGSLSGTRTLTTYRWSDDAGETWHEAEVDLELRDLTGVGHLRRVGDGWWAMAEGHDGYVALRSPDGRTWSRTPIDRTELDPDRDSFSGVVQVGDHLVAAGNVGQATGVTQVGAWTSRDGVDWEPAALRGTGLISAIAARGKTVVAVGSTDGEADELTRAAVWRSQDGGQTWTPQPRPRVSGQDARFVSRLSGVEAVEDGFVATMRTAVTQGGYRALAYHSIDGRDWRTERLPKGIADTEADFVDVLADGGVTILAMNPQINISGDEPRLARRVKGGWRDTARPAGLGGAGEWSVTDLVQTSSATLLFTRRSQANTSAAGLWRSEDDGASFTVLRYPAAEADLPVVQPMSLARTEDGYVAVGDANGLPAIWSGTPEGEFGPAARLSVSPDDTVHGVAAHGRTVVAWGQRRTLVNDKAMAWSGEPGGTVAPIRAPFQAAGDYANSNVIATRWIGGDWWMVGRTSANGGLNESALVLQGPSLTSLRRGKASTIIHRSTGDEDYEVSDLSGDRDRGRTMADLVQVEGTMMAVGQTSDADGGELPARWTRGKDGTWSLHELPTTGIVRGWATGIEARGSDVIITGAGFQRGSSRTVPYFWISADGGATFTGHPAPTADPQGGIGRARLVDGGYVAVGRTGAEHAEPVLYRSTDAKSWTVEPLPVLRSDPDTQEATIPDAILEGNLLTMLVQVTSLDGRQSASRIVQHQL